MRILIVEDEVDLALSLKKGLESEGYAVDLSYDGEDALFQIEVNQYDLIVLDLNLPKLDGLDVLKTVRQNYSELKVIILSARVSVEERIIGIKEGADDYLVKPFDYRELETRIENLLHRQFVQRSTQIAFNGLVLNTKTKRLEKNGTELNLTRKEYGILEYLVFHKNQVISAEELIEHVWNEDVNPFSSSLRYHISSLKKKVQNKFNVEIINTIRGQGYIIEEKK